MASFFKQIDEQHVTNNFRGILVLGDVHGIMPPFEKAVRFASENNLYMVSLGDIVDYGPQSKAVTYLMKMLVDDNRASVILGNHEKKLQKYFVQKKEGEVRIKIKNSLQASIDSFTDEASIEAFFAIHDQMANIMRFKNVYFTHGALHRSVIDNGDQYSALGYQLALFGEVDNTLPTRADGFPNRVFNWVNDIPEHVRVFVGHDIRSATEPVVHGNATFLDTGCGKEGVLHGAVLDHSGALKEFVNFGGQNRHGK